MKLEQQRLVYANSQRLQNINDSQFLTFRNSNQNSVRSIYSQKVQLLMKKANQKQKTISSDDQSSTKSINAMRNFKKKVNNNLRSAAVIKARQRSKSPIRRQRSKSPLRTMLQAKRPYETNNINTLNLRQNEELEFISNDDNPQYEFRNQLFRKKIHKLIKNIKIQQRKQHTLQKQIEQITKQIEQDQKQIENQTSEIQELDSIYQQNQAYLEKLLRNYQDFQTKNNQLEKVVQKIQESLQNLVKTSRQQDSKQKTANKLKQGLIKLQKLKTQINNRSIKIQTQIQKMKQYIDQGQNIDLMIRDLTYNGKDLSSNNSHFTY